MGALETRRGVPGSALAGRTPARLLRLPLWCSRFLQQGAPSQPLPARRVLGSMRAQVIGQEHSPNGTVAGWYTQRGRCTPV